MKRLPRIPALCRSLVLLLFAALLPGAVPGEAQVVSPYMSYQGWLADGSGNPLGGAAYGGPQNYDVVFRIWDTMSGGAVGSADERYAEEQTVTVNNGYFSVRLGAGSQFLLEPQPPLATVFNAPAPSGLYLEVTVRGVQLGGDYTVLPRQLLLAAPYAFQAQYAVSAASAAFAGGMGTSGDNSALVTAAGNLVGIIEPLVVNGAMTIPSLTIGGVLPVTNTLLTVNGSASAQSLTVTGPNALLAGGLVVSNTASALSLTAGAVQVTQAISGGSLGAGSVTVTNAATAAALNVSGTNAAGSVTVTNNLQAQTVTVSGALQFVSSDTGSSSQTLCALGGTQAIKIIESRVLTSSGCDNPAVSCNFTNTAPTVDKGQPICQVSFSAPFTGTPVVVVQPLWTFNGDTTQLTPIVYNVTASGFSVTFINWGNNDAQDGFHFIAVGPP